MARAASRSSGPRRAGPSCGARGARQTTSSGLAVSIGAFHGRPSATAVACRYGAVQHTRARFVVAARVSPVTATTWTLLGAGLLLGAAGAGLIVWAVRHPIVSRDPP